MIGSRLTCSTLHGLFPSDHGLRKGMPLHVLRADLCLIWAYRSDDGSLIQLWVEVLVDVRGRDSMHPRVAHEALHAHGPNVRIFFISRVSIRKKEETECKLNVILEAPLPHTGTLPLPPCPIIICRNRRMASHRTTPANATPI